LKCKSPKMLATMAANALLKELAASPKPGLVDRLSSGSHHDMDFFTFIDGITAITPYFEECVMMGKRLAEDSLLLFAKLREIGLRCEKAMYDATDGVNTHKGAIFALGIILAAYASNFVKRGSDVELLRGSIKQLCGALPQTELPHDPTKGERLSALYRIKGAREQAIEGFPVVFDVGLPLYRKVKNCLSLNDAAVHTLIGIIGAIDDTNIVSRAGMEELRRAQDEANQALSIGGMLTVPGREAIDMMCVNFKARNISPGGSADMLSATLFIDSLII
jgi:triphosphoribosyl-dephospho-CoA synthase